MGDTSGVASGAGAPDRARPPLREWPLRASARARPPLDPEARRAQLALRAAMAETGIDDVLERKLQIGEGLLDVVAARGESLGVEVDAVEIRDVILPGRPASCIRGRRAC